MAENFLLKNKKKNPHPFIGFLYYRGGYYTRDAREWKIKIACCCNFASYWFCGGGVILCLQPRQVFGMMIFETATPAPYPVMTFPHQATLQTWGAFLEAPCPRVPQAK